MTMHSKGVCLIIILLVQKNLASNSIQDKETLKEEYRNLSRVDFSMATATDPNRIGYKLYIKYNPDAKIILTEETVKCQNIDKSIKTILLIHGYSADDTSPWYGVAKKNYFQKGSFNIIYINWSAYGNLSYDVSAANVKPVGEFIARFLKNSQVPPQNIHILGHSMGGQLAAFIGKAYKRLFGKLIGRISGLDPSGRKFSNKEMNKEERLNKLDANFVDVVHTNIQIFGFTKPCGHADFYPNGGADQPGCPDDEPREKCNHHRSYMFFVESIITKVEASEIDFKEDKNYRIIISPKEFPKKVIFGENIEEKTRGIYYLKTNPTKPFLEKNLKLNCNFR